MNEIEFGAQIRRARLIEDLTQQEVADRANVTRTTLAKLETGQGSSLATLIKVLRALGRDDWLGTLEPLPAISPQRLAREAAGIAEPQRASRRTRKHLMSVNGKFDAITQKDLHAVGEQFAVPACRDIIRDVRQAVADWPEFAQQAQLPHERTQAVHDRLKEL